MLSHRASEGQEEAEETSTYLTQGEGSVGGTAAQRHDSADLRQAAPAAPDEAPHQEPSHQDPSTRGHGR
jgi:hypothetical protein